MSFANACVSQGYKSLRAIPSVSVDQATVGTVQLTLKDPVTGEPIDLTQYGIFNSSSSSSSGEFTGVNIVVKEMPNYVIKWYETHATIIDAAKGIVEIPYDEQQVRRSGVFTAEAQIWQDGHMRRIMPFYFNVNPSLQGQPCDSGYTLSIAEIRMTLRDTDPEGNVLIDQLEFTQEEIMLAIRRCVNYWNEVPPPVGYFTPTNFRWPYHLSVGVASVLYGIATKEKLRNNLDYNAGGLTVQDTMKWVQYREMQDRMWAEWVAWVKDKKYAINIDGAFMVMGSGYAYDRYYR